MDVGREEVQPEDRDEREGNPLELSAHGGRAWASLSLCPICTHEPCEPAIHLRASMPLRLFFWGRGFLLGQVVLLYVLARRPNLDGRSMGSEEVQKVRTCPASPNTSAGHSFVPCGL